MVRGRLRTALAALLAAGALAVAAAAPAPAATLVDPLEGSPWVADLGELTATLRTDGVLETRTQVVARPPAGWGGCVPLDHGICMLTEMDVTWRMGYRVGGAPGDGADARVVATPVWSQTAWRLDLWSDAAQRWQVATPPLGTTDAGGVSWSLPLTWLGTGIGDGRLSLRAISRFVPLDAAGRPEAAVFDETDWLELPLPSAVLGGSPDAPATPPSERAPGARTPTARGDSAPRMPTPAQLTACNKARARLSTLDRRIRRAAKAAKRGPAARRRAARRELRRLRTQRDAALSSKRRTCARASQPPSLPIPLS